MDITHANDLILATTHGRLFGWQKGREADWHTACRPKPSGRFSDGPSRYERTCAECQSLTQTKSRSNAVTTAKGKYSPALWALDLAD